MSKDILRRRMEVLGVLSSVEGMRRREILGSGDDILRDLRWPKFRGLVERDGGWWFRTAKGEDELRRYQKRNLAE